MKHVPARHNPAPRPWPGGGTGPACVVGLLWVLLLPLPSLGHGIDLRTGQGPAAWVQGEYSTGEAMSFVKTRVLGPDGKTFQVGNSDARGRFAWLPDRAGPWRVVLDDGQGHHGEAVLDWRADADAAPTEDDAPAAGLAGQPLWARAVWGLSLFFWLSGLAFWRLGRRRRV